jgi:signal transduction histidine kinase
MGLSDSRPILPQLRLDDLLTELQGRLQAILATRDRVYALLEAVVAVGQNLDLDVLLRQIVEASVTLVGAQYGALGVVGEGDRLVEFVPAGREETDIVRIRQWPGGRGVLGLLIQDPRPVRLADISAHPDSFGFPEGHSPTVSFLGVPLRVREEVYGSLYLTGKQDGGEFDEEDEALVVALAAAAGVAIDNARLYEEARRQERWLRASGEVARRLLSGTPTPEVLDLVTEQALEMSGADLVALALPTPDGQRLLNTHAAGAGADRARGLVLPLTSLSGAILASGEAAVVENFASDERVSPAAREHMPLGPAIVVPMGAPGNVRGVLTVGRTPGSLPFPPSAADMVGTFAAQAAIALELAEHRDDAERLAVLQDRDRIARDLHDLVIQRLYATGMSLQGALPMIGRAEPVDRVSGAVDSLDETIREIRSAIFSLQSNSGPKPPGLRARVLEVVEEMSAPLGFAPSLRMMGPLDEAVSGEAGEQLLGALREALSNVARHASASKAEVTVEAGPDLLLRVSDNGRGLGHGTRRSGLANLSERAGQLGGELVLGAPDDGGTELEWRVPSPGDARSGAARDG